MSYKSSPRTIRLATLAVIGMVVISIALSVVLLRWSFQPSEVLKVNNSPVPVQPPETKNGSKVFLTIDFCKAIGATGVSTVNLLGEAGAKIAINWPLDTTDKGCAVYNEVPIPIPSQTPSDTYHVEFKTCYDVNPLKRDKCTTFSSQKFKVINTKLNPGDAQVLETR